MKLPELVKILEGYGMATDKLQAKLAMLKAKFPAGDVPLSVVEQLVREAMSPAMLDNIVASVTADLVKLLQTGKSKIKRDDSALA